MRLGDYRKYHKLITEWVRDNPQIVMHIKDRMNYTSDHAQLADLAKEIIKLELNEG